MFPCKETGAKLHGLLSEKVVEEVVMVMTWWEMAIDEHCLNKNLANKGRG